MIDHIGLVPCCGTNVNSNSAMAFPESEISLILSFEGKFLASVDFLSKESGPCNINDDLI